MRRVLLTLLALTTFACFQASAEINAEQLTEPDYLINNGYSEATAEEVLIMKNRIAGRPAEPLYERKYNRFTRFIRNMYGYIDPAYDTDERIKHDIHMSPSAKDL